MTTDINERMRLFTDGQVTWPEPKLGRRCKDCKWFSQDDVAPSSAFKGKGRCEMVRQVNPKMTPRVIDGSKAIACPKFEETE